MRKFLLGILTLSLMLGLLAACGNSDSGKDKAKDPASQDKGELVIGIDDKFAPMGFRDDNNEITGFDIDYARAAGEKMGYEVKFQPIDWKAKESELNSGRIDLIWNGYTITPDREDKVNFTRPYLRNTQVVAVLEDSEITELAQLEAKEIGIQSLSSAVDAFNAHEIHTKVKGVSEFSDNVLALNDLKVSRVDAVVIDEVVIDYYMTKEPGSFRILDETLSPEEYGVGVSKQNDDLLKELQKALDELNEDGTAGEISEKWFGEDKVLK